MRPAGLGWDGTHLWMVSDSNQTIYKLDPETMVILDSMPTPAADWSFGLDHDGVNLWGDLDEPELIYQLDETTGVVLNSFSSPHVSPNGVAFDGSQVWHSSFGGDLALMNPTTGTLTRVIPSPGNNAPRGLEWVDGTLWVVDGNGYDDDAIYKVDPSDGTVLETYQPAGATFSLICGLAFDGTHFWLSDLDTGKIHKLLMAEGLIFYDGFESGNGSGWTTEAGCIPEGDMGSGFVPTPCCLGLAVISCSEPMPGGGCMTMSDCFVCTFCGDGICGPGENVCNCPDDC